MSERDRERLLDIDYLLADPDLFETIEAEDGVTFTFGWRRAIEKSLTAQRRATIQRIFDAAAATASANEPGPTE